MTRTVDPAASPPVARLRGPAELAAALPQLCGFVPTESLVVVALHGDRSRVGLTLRVDLPAPAHEPAVVADVVARVQAAGPRAAVAIVCTEAGDAGGVARRTLVELLRRRLRAAGIAADDALLVRAGRWRSYVCDSPQCCPPGGTPLSAAAGSGLALMQAHAALDGRAALGSREELVASLAPPVGAAATRARLWLHDAEQRLGARRARVGAARARAGDRQQWRVLLDRAAAPPLALTGVEAAELAVTLADPGLRDEVLTWLLDDDAALLTLLLAVVGCCVAPWDAPVCALVAWTAHARGDGGLANVALDRALTSRPGYPLALLSWQALEGQLEPGAVRVLLADTRRALHG